MKSTKKSNAKRPLLHLMSRVRRDVKTNLDFIRRTPWGKPLDRERDINECLDAILERPTAGKVGIRRQDTGVELRRRDARQFSVIYACFPPDAVSPGGVVSIRAVRHRRVRNVFLGVRESSAVYGETGSSAQ